MTVFYPAGGAPSPSKKLFALPEEKKPG